MEKSLLEALRLFGLTEYEARAYVALLEEGRGSPQAIAAASGVPRTRIYEVLGSLHEKGFALIVSHTPRLAEPVTPEKALEQSMKRSASEIQEAARLILQKIKAPAKPDKNPERIMLAGKKSIERTLYECAQKAHEILAWGVPGWFFTRLSFFSRLERRKKEIVVSSFEESLAFMGMGFLVFVVKRIFFTGVFIFDRREAVAFPYIQASRRLEGLWTSHKDSVESFYLAYLDHRKFAERI